MRFWRLTSARGSRPKPADGLLLKEPFFLAVLGGGFEGKPTGRPQFLAPPLCCVMTGVQALAAAPVQVKRLDLYRFHPHMGVGSVQG